MPHLALRFEPLPTATVSQKEKLRRMLPILSPDSIPTMGLIQEEDRYIERQYEQFVLSQRQILPRKSPQQRYSRFMRMNAIRWSRQR